MAFELPNLPYALDALAPHISKETLEFHHGRHHATYVTNLNNLIKGGKFEKMSLEEIIKEAGQGPVFNNAAQHFNHGFYWNCMRPHGGGEPRGRMAEAINKSCGDFATFKKAFTDTAVGHFGSGWAWLVQNADGSLAVEGGHDADNPVVHNKRAILVCDVWEHAYYIDYRNARARYVEAFWNIVNWDFAESNLK